MSRNAIKPRKKVVPCLAPRERAAVSRSCILQLLCLQEFRRASLQPLQPIHKSQPRFLLPHRKDGLRLESCGHHVCNAACSDLLPFHVTDSRSYNRYLAIAARVVRRSLKEGPRLQAEKRGEMDLRFAKWQVSSTTHIRSIGFD